MQRNKLFYTFYLGAISYEHAVANMFNFSDNVHNSN